MAKLKALPELNKISGFRGKVDYYLYHPTCNPELKGAGIPCARRWPRSPGPKRAPLVEAQWSTFTYASQHWSELSEEIQDSYRKMAEGTGLTGRDMFTRSYLTGLYPYDLPEEALMIYWTKVRAYRSGTQQVIPTGTDTKVRLNAKSFDTLEEYDHVTNYRFTPSHNGYYAVFAALLYQDMGDTKRYWLMLFKNGALHSANILTAGRTHWQSVTVADLIYLTTSDCLELYTHHEHGSNRNTAANSPEVFMSIARVG